MGTSVPVAAPSPGQTSLPIATVRRLSAVELRNAISDLFFMGNLAQVPAVQDDSGDAKFDTEISALVPQIEFVGTTQLVAEQVSLSATVDLKPFLGCDSTAPTQPCVDAFVRSWGERVYRRPVMPDEAARLTKVFARGMALLGVREAVRGTLELMLMSPNFIFRTELGQVRDPAGVVALTAYERASFLSFTLWKTTPDEALLAAARTGELATEAGLLAQVNRMLSMTGRARTVLGGFVGDWLTIHPTAGPGVDDVLASEMASEVNSLIDGVLWSGASKFTDLWTTTATKLGKRLPVVYGASGATAGTLSAAGRSGILTRAGSLASLLGAEFSPTHMGKVLRSDVFCQNLKLPVGTVPDPPMDPKLTARQRAGIHSANPACAGCHAMIDPIGLAFEAYDGVGRYKPSSALSEQGSLSGTDVDGMFVGAVALSERISRSRQVRDCYASQFLAYALGFNLLENEGKVPTAVTATAGKVGEALAQTDNMRDAIRSLLLSAPMLQRDATKLPVR